MARATRSRGAATLAALDAHLTRLDRMLSRTVATGRADTTASPLKTPPLVTGAALAARLAGNRRLVARFIAWRRRARPGSATEHLGVLCTLAHLAGLGVFPAGLFRAWDYDPARWGVRGRLARVPAAAVGAALAALAKRVAAAPARPEERLALIAGVEWDLGIGPLHPFYDGCGRISRYYATLLALWLDTPRVEHATREGYFRAARAGRAAFVAYYRARAGAGRRRSGDAGARA